MQIEKTSPTVFTPLDDGTGVVLNIETLNYYGLNRTGASVWRLIEDASSVSLEDIVRYVCDKYEVTEDAARIDVRAFIEHLARFQMIRAGGDPS